MPSLRTDADAESFTDTADLAEYDLSGFKPMRFEIAPKAAVLNMRLPGALLEAVKVKAKAQGVPYARYVRMLLETDVAKPSVSPRLTLADAVAIHRRRAAGETSSRLASSYNVNPARVAEVLQGKLFPGAQALAFPAKSAGQG